MLEVLLTCTLIVLARIVDVSLGTFRTALVIQGRKGLAFLLGFAEVLVWVLVVSRVIETVAAEPAYAIAYAFGFACGNWIGIAIEQRFAIGRQVLRIFTRQGFAAAARLREAGFGVTEFEGRGRDGPISLLFIATERRRGPEAIALARAADPGCYYTVEDLRTASTSEVPSRGDTDRSVPPGP